MLNRPSKEQTRLIGIDLQLKRNKLAKKYEKVFKILYKQIALYILSLHKLNQYVDYKRIIKEKYKNKIVSILTNLYHDGYLLFGFHFRDLIKKQDNKKSFTFLYEIKSTKLEDLYYISLIDTLDKMADLHSDYLIDSISNKLIDARNLSNAKVNETYFDKVKELNDLQKLLLLSTGSNFSQINEKIQKLTNEVNQSFFNRNESINDVMEDQIFDNIIRQHSEVFAREESLFAESHIRQAEASLVENETKKKVYKEWNSVFAENSRETHMEASGQVKLQNEKFLVRHPKTLQSEYGMHPKDDSFSIGNKIHCLCFVIYYLDN